jgi:hypothetical protein
MDSDYVTAYTPSRWKPIQQYVLDTYLVHSLFFFQSLMQSVELSSGKRRRNGRHKS